MMSATELPSEWKMMTFGDITKNSKYGCNPDETGENVSGVPFLRITDLKENIGKVKELPQKSRFSDESNKDKYLLEDGDFVIARSGSIGQSYVYELDDGKMVYASYLIKFELDERKVTKGFINLYLQSPSYWEQVNKTGRGGTQQNINAGQIKNFKIPVPPLEEQERIVEHIDTKIGSIKSACQKVNNLQTLSTEYRDSAFTHLLSGVNMKGIEQNLSLPDTSVVPDNWRVCELNEIADRLRSTYETESGVDYDLYSFEAVDEGQGFFVTDGEEINSRKRELFGGEVLISRLNPRISRVCKVDYESENKQVASTEFVALDLTTDAVSREFLYQYLKTPLIREYLMNQTTGSTGSHSRVSFDEVMSLPVPIPPEEEQERLITELSNIEQNAQTVEDSVNVVDQYLEEYRKSVLHHAFTGELV